MQPMQCIAMKDLTKHNVALNDSLPQIGQLLFSLERSVNAILRQVMNEESRLKNRDAKSGRYICVFFQLVLIFGLFWVIFGPIWVILAILGHFWAILGNFG